jgi:hypothetical protein
LPTGPLLFWSAVGIALLHTGSLPLTTNDLAIYLAMGREMAQSGSLHQVEEFTFTASGTPFVNGTWGFSVLAWQLFDAFGANGLRLLNGLAVAAAVAGMGLAAQARGVDPRAAAAASLYTWWMLLQNTIVRSQTWVFPIFAALSWLAAARRPPGIALAGGVLGGILWANLHGSFPAGLVAFGAWAVGQAWDARDWRAGLTPAAVGLGLALGACIGPYGPALWGYVLDNSTLPVDRGFVEWLPPSPSEFHGIRLFGALGLWLWLLGRSRSRAPTAWLLLVLGFALLAIRGTRFVAWFGLATAIPLAECLSASMSREGGLPRRLLRPMQGVLITLWAVLLAKGLAPLDQPLHPDTPVALVDSIAADLADHPGQARVFTPPEYGGYVAHRLYPNALVSGDIRTWIFDDEAWNFYLEVSELRSGWQQQLADRHVTHLLLWRPFHGGRLDDAIAAGQGWILLERTEFGSAWRRDTESSWAQ